MSRIIICADCCLMNDLLPYIQQSSNRREQTHYSCHVKILSTTPWQFYQYVAGWRDRYARQILCHTQTKNCQPNLKTVRTIHKQPFAESFSRYSPNLSSRNITVNTGTRKIINRSSNMTDLFLYVPTLLLECKYTKNQRIKQISNLKKTYKSRVCTVLSCIGASISLSLEALMTSSLEAIKTLCVADFVAYIYYDCVP